MARRSEQLERQAESARAQLAATLEELRAKLSPSQFVDELMDYTREGGAAELARNFGRDIRAHPLSVALVAAGLGWLFMENARAARENGVGRAAETEGGSKAAGSAAGATDSLGRGASDAGSLFLQFCREQPVVMAGLGLAAGAAVGAALASTETGKRFAEEAGEAAAGGAERTAAPRPEKAKDALGAQAEGRPAARTGFEAARPVEPQSGARPVTHH